MIGKILYRGEVRRIAVVGADEERGLIHAVDVDGVRVRSMIRLRVGIALGWDWARILSDPAFLGRYRTFHADMIERAP